MIPIIKPDAPSVLIDRGTTATQKLCEAYTANSNEYRTGARVFAFDRSIYASDTVKRTLLEAQHVKCAFCESLFAHVGYGDVEHFRPKAGYKQSQGDELTRPGYYWLAYEWDNLLCSCQLCNQRFKRNLFPLKDNRRRARAHTHKLGKEQPLLVNPAEVDPAAFVAFRREYAYPVKGCLEGQTTVEAFGLNREELAEVRRKRLEDLENLVLACRLLREKIATTPTAKLTDQLHKLEDRLREKSGSSGEYAAMVQAALDVEEELDRE